MRCQLLLSCALSLRFRPWVGWKGSRAMAADRWRQHSGMAMLQQRQRRAAAAAEAATKAVQKTSALLEEQVAAYNALGAAL